jgi:c-di-AMP phosphodiesterase-like protein
MNKKNNLSIDIIVLIITAIWISDLNFSNLTILQVIGLILVVIVVILMIIKLFRKGK